VINYEKRLSRTAQDIKPSGIRKFFDMVGSRSDVISLTVGQPDFVTPWHIREAGIDSLVTGKTYYTSNSGLIEMRREISKYLARRFGLSYGDGEIIVTVGGSEAIDIAMRATVNPGDEVIVPQPSFVCYEPIARLCGGKPVIVTTEEKDSFRLTSEKLRGAITDRTKLIVLPFPNNPTGAVMKLADLEAIADILRGTEIFVLSDEIYAEMTYGGKHVSIASLPGMRERTVIVNGFSKAYAMTGWRMGYTAAPAEITRQMLKIHQYAIMCAPTVSQFAAIEALKNGDGDIGSMTDEYDVRRRFLVSGLRQLGIPVFEPEGAFYVFPRIGVTGLDSETFCSRLLEEGGVAVVPGTAFGECGEGFARISYAYSLRHIEEALRRIGNFMKTL
jgi:aminotransferase